MAALRSLGSTSSVDASIWVCHTLVNKGAEEYPATSWHATAGDWKRSDKVSDCALSSPHLS